jgi:hypothetical protein
MIGAFLLYLLKWALGLAAGAFVLKLAAIGGDMLLERTLRR